MIYFCGYPVPATIVDGRGQRDDFVACGKPATPGCAFCDEHGELFEKENEPPSPAEWERWILIVIAMIVCLVGLFQPVHTWLNAHLELLLGFLLGTLGQSIPWLASLLSGARWARDRWRWLKWFSWQ